MPIRAHLASLWRNLIRKGRVERELTEEVESYLEMLVEAKVNEGLRPVEARRAALIDMGGVEQVKERVREVRMGQTLETIWQDLRYGARMLWKNPGVTVLVALSLTLGIAANTTIFSVINTLLLVPPPVEHPDGLWQIWRVNLRTPAAIGRYKVTTFPSLQFLREHQQSFRLLGAMQVEPTSVTWNRDGDGITVQSLTVSGNYFELCGIRPLRGRMFLPEEDRTPGTHPVTVISYPFWQSRFGADPAVIGKTMLINGTELTIVGVAPPDFTGAIAVVAPEMWLPYAIAPKIFRDPALTASHDRSSSIGLGRLKSGVTAAQAEAELSSLMRRLEEIYPQYYKDVSAGLLPSFAVPMQARAMIAEFTGILMAAVFFVLLIACANAANLLLARATSRRAEMAMRAALGANRGRLIRQLLTESVLLALLGGACGMLLTAWLTKLIVQLIPESLPMRLSLAFDWRVFAFATLVSLLTGLIFGLAPAWRSSRLDLTTVIKSGSRETSARGSRLAHALIVAQTAVCLILLVAGTLCLRSLMKAQSLDPGFRIADRVVADLNLQDYGYSEVQSQAFYARLLERIAAQPGVRSAAIANHLPLGTTNNSMTIAAAEQPAQFQGGGTTVEAFVITPGYFATMGTNLLLGRDFNPGDRDGAPLVAIINETAATRFWRGENPIGRRLMNDAAKGEIVEVIGVAQNGKYRSFGEEPRPAIFLSFQQRPETRATLVVHVSGDATVALAALRQVTKESDPRLALSHVATLDRYLAYALFPVRTSALLLGILGGVALLLAASGLFGVISYSVAQRTHEIGVRMALGARQGQVVRQVMSEGLRLAGWGIVLGLVGAFALTRLIRSMLFNVSATDPLTFVTIPLLLTAVAALACWVPARRAVKVDPLVALRCE